MLHYEVVGQGKSLVFLHGFMENHKIWLPLVSELSKNFQMVLIDLSGHGKSKTIRSINTIEDMADDVIEVLNHLQIHHASFIGHSMGGYVGLAIAEVYPQLMEKLVLVNSTTLPDTKEKKEQRLKVIPTIHRNYALFVKLSIPMLFSEELKPHLQNEMNGLKSIALETSIDGVEAALKGIRERPDRTFVLYDSNFPILILNGTKDTTIDVELFETTIPEKENIKVISLDCGHVAFIERKDAFIYHLTTFLTQEE